MPPRVFGLRSALFRATLLACALTATAGARITFHVSPNGSDTAAGTDGHPLATLAAAQRLVRAHPARGREPIEVIVAPGTYYLAEPLAFTAGDSGAPGADVTYRAATGGEVVLSGGQTLALHWQPERNGVWVADTPAGLGPDQLFVDGKKQVLARYPNFDPAVVMLNGHAADAATPTRTARWTAPAGGYLHTLDANLWGSFHYRILGKNPDGTLSLEGGWQTNRPVGMHASYRFVENILEELDAPGEWFHDRAAGKLYFFPPAGLDLGHARVETVRLRELAGFRGTQAQPVRHVILAGFTFRHAARTFMETKEPLLRSDWTVYRGGAIFFTGAEDCTLASCRVEEVGGNAVFVSGYNRRVAIRECLLDAAGASGALFVGLPAAVRNPLFSATARQSAANLDPAPGPQTDDYPMDCRIEDCVIRAIGRIEKQAAGVEISMARRIAIVDCSIYDVPRAGINIGDGCWGGHLIEGCDVFDTVRETGDHGSFNAWGRDRYWHAEGAAPAQLAALSRLDALEPTVIRHNRWRCDHGWDIDLDDGSSNYVIEDNLLLNGGLKLREGFDRTATNNVIVNNSLHPHVWFEGSGDTFTHNIVMSRYRPALMKVARWGRLIDGNFFAARESDRLAFAAQGCDGHSLAGEAGFVDPARGDFRVGDHAPALQAGFRNFPMDRFGVRSPALRALARTPDIPPLRTPAELDVPPLFRWHGALLRSLAPGEFSALGVVESSAGLLLTEVPAGSPAAGAGLRAGDFIESIDGEPVKSPQQFGRKLLGLAPGDPAHLRVRRQQATLDLALPPPFLPPARSGP